VCIRGRRKCPSILTDADEIAARDDACELFDEEATLASATKTEFADELLVACAMACGTANSIDQIAIAVGIRRAGHRLL
jgi:hypothetical protein